MSIAGSVALATRAVNMIYQYVRQFLPCMTKSMASIIEQVATGFSKHFRYDLLSNLIALVLSMSLAMTIPPINMYLECL